MEHVMVSIVAPEGREDALTEDLRAAGVTAWTAWTVRGAGEHGVRPTKWRTPSVRIDVVAEPVLADAILVMLAEKHPRSSSVFVATTPARVPFGGL